jgi:hypothetical protein
MNENEIQLLVGDNAFHGISHLSQKRARERTIRENPSDVAYAAHLVNLSLQNGATGFMFSVSNTTLTILKMLDANNKPDLYAIVPYAHEYVRLATKTGGISGLAMQITKEIVFSRKILSVAPYLIGIIKADLRALLKTYLTYEISRIRSASQNKANLKTVLLHEVITDMALSLNLDWFFKEYVKFLSKKKIQPGFETRNFPYLIRKLTDWDIDLSKLAITASFNKVGFQMNPSKEECERVLQDVSGAQIIAMSALAAGYLELSDAISYLASIPTITHIVVGVSKEKHAYETFKQLHESL